MDNYQTIIQVKTNAPEVLRKELERLYSSQQRSLVDYTDNRNDPKRPIIGVSGGVSDSYQDAEKKYRLTLKILEILKEYGYPVFLLTKSNLVLRDIELLKEINEKAYANICFSITQTDEETRKNYEPYSSTTWERFEALKELRREGISGGVMAMPMIPYISDGVENMRQLVEDAKRVGSGFVLFAGMTLKPGRQKDCFLDTVRKYNPDKVALLEEIYCQNNRYGQPDYTKVPANVMTLGHHLCRKTGVNPRSVRHRCQDEYQSNHLVLQRILDMLFWMSYILGYTRSSWSKLYDIAIQLENGVPDLKQALERDRLSDIIDSKHVEMVSDIINRGTSTEYENIKNQVDQIAEQDYHRQIG